MTDQARRVSEALSKCFSDLATSDGALKTEGRSFRTPGVGEHEFKRLCSWLNRLAKANDAVSYAALLQIWLNSHGIGWPPSVFASGKDLTSGGRGSRGKSKIHTGEPFKVDRKRVRDLQNRGMSWPEIAVDLGLAKNKHKKTVRQAGERLRKALRPHLYPVGSLDDDVVALGLVMLGIHTPTDDEDYQDYVDRILGPDNDTNDAS